MQTTETVTVAAIGHKGDGVAETPTGRVFVPGSLPGETVTIARDGERGRIISIEAPSADRIAAACRHVGTCGGCSLQHMAPAAYLAFKRQSVIDAFADRGIEVSVAETVPVEAHSRRRAVIAVQRQEGRLVVGFRERLSHTVAPAEGCLVVTPAIAAAMPKLAELCDLLTFGKKGAICTVLDTETGLDLAIAEAELPDKRRAQAIERAMRLGFARLAIGGELIVEARAPQLTFGGVAVHPAPGAFIQAVASAEATIADMVAAATEGSKRILDLFAGSGTFTLRLARHAPVHAVEAEKTALAALDKAWRFARGLKLVSTEARDLYRRPFLPKELEKFDAVVFDPPRDGAAPVAKEIARSKVPLVVAVSCNPATLARDARYLVDGGYRIDTVVPVDQFLWSHHVEAVAVFRRG